MQAEKKKGREGEQSVYQEGLKTDMGSRKKKNQPKIKIDEFIKPRAYIPEGKDKKTKTK
jgi:hypothetical protein